MIQRASLLVLLWTLSALGADPRLIASLDRTTVRVGESLSLTLTFDGSATGVSSPQLPAVTGVQFTGGPFTSTNMSIVNGRTSASITYTYRLRAVKEGKHQIGTAGVTYQGKPYESVPILVSILPAGAAPPPGTSGGEEATSTADNVFIRAIPDRTECVQGEQITVSYKIFFNVQMTNPEITKIPRAPGFWMEEVALPQQLHLNDEVVNGKAYKSAVIRKLALFPTSTGELEVEPMDVQTKIERKTQRRSRDPLDIFNDPYFRLGSSMEPVEVSSPQVKIKVRPLPDGAPPEFNGAVGNFKISAAFDRNQVNTNDAVTLTVRVEGAGNIKTLPEPVVQFPPDFDRFDPKQSEQISRGAKISGAKIFEYVLIPRAPGVQQIPEIRYAFFDPASEKYQSLSTPALALNVARGNGDPGAFGSTPGIARRDVTSVGTDIAYLKKRPGAFRPLHKAPHQTFGFWMFALSPWIAASGAFVFAARRAKTTGIRPTFSANLKHAVKSLNEAAKCAQKNPADALRLMQTAVESVLSERELEAVDVFEAKAISERWIARGRDATVLERLLRIQHDCNLARFGIGRSDAETCKRLLDDARSALADLAKSETRKEATA